MRAETKSAMPKKLKQGLLIGSVATLVAVLLHSAGAMDNWLERALWDWRVRTFHDRLPRREDIRLIDIDQSSIDWAEKHQGVPWPWPRQVYVRVLRYLKQAGAKAVIFDGLLNNDSSWGVEDDLAFSRGIAETGIFVPVAMIGRDGGKHTSWPTELGLPDIDVEGFDAFLTSREGKRLSKPRAHFPIPEIATNCTLVGDALLMSDSDGVARRTPPFRIFDGHFVPSLGLAAYMAVNPDATLKLSNRILHVGDHSIPFDASGRSVLSFKRFPDDYSVSIASVIQSYNQLKKGIAPTVDPAHFKDCYVFVGTTAAALLDLKPTPLDTQAPGVDIHVAFLENLLSDGFIRRSPLSTVLLITFALSALAATAAGACSSAWKTVLAFVFFLALPLVPGVAAYLSGYWLPIGVLQVSVLLAMVGAVFVNYMLEGHQKRFIRSAFKQYLSPIVIERLLEDPGHLRLGGETKDLTIFFSDIQGFTTISETLDPQTLTSLLNDYLTAMTDIILEEGGTIDKYEGDAIIAFWNAPVDQSNHAIRGVRAALRCQQKLEELRPEFKERVGHDILARIGMNTGSVVVGNMGSTQRFDYTFLGDAGNLASRLEGINKQYGTFVMISESTLSQLEDNFAARELSRVRVKGKLKPVTVFEPMLKEQHTERADMLNTFDAGLKAYYKGDFKAAIAEFEKIQDQDPPAVAYIRKCKDLIANPSETWDGVWVMTEK